MCRVSHDYTKTKQFQVCIPESQIQNVLELTHDGLIGGHLGTEKCYHYFYPSLLERYGKRYHSLHFNLPVCAQIKPRNKSNKLPLKIRAESIGPMMELFIDTIGPLPMTKRGNKYIQVVVDMHTRFCFAWPSQ